MPFLIDGLTTVRHHTSHCRQLCYIKSSEYVLGFAVGFMIKRFIKRVKTLTHLRVAFCPTAGTSLIRQDFGV